MLKQRHALSKELLFETHPKLAEAVNDLREMAERLEMTATSTHHKQLIRNRSTTPSSIPYALSSTTAPSILIGIP